MKNLANTTYGNFDLVDETGSIYVYGLTSSKVAKNDKSYASLGLQEGDIVTLVGTRAAYNDAAQVGGPAYYISHVEGTTEPEEPETTVEPETPAEGTLTLTNAEICAVMTSSETSYVEYTIESVTIHFTDKKKVYPNNVYCAFPSTWTAPTEDAAYPEDGNVGRAVTDDSYSVTIPVAEGNKQVYVSIIGTYAYYVDHIDVAF